MALFAISDLHISSDNKKSMEVFGPKWADYMNRIKGNWKAYISEKDTVIVPGDISWGTYLDDAVEDFRFLDNLPGKKIIIKGNHDYWWTTLNKLNEFLEKNNFSSISILNNNSFIYNKTLICGTRGWLCPGQTGFTQEDAKTFAREVQRLKLSLESGKGKDYKRIIAALHYPPFDKDNVLNPDIEKLFAEYNVEMCLYGHLHGPSHNDAFVGEQKGVEFRLVAADYLEFVPLQLSQEDDNERKD